MKPIEVNDANFTEDVLNSDIPVLVDFWAPWCAPCRMIAPILEEISADFAGRVKIAKLNTDQSSIAQKYHIRSIPTLLLFRDGEVVDQIVGAVAKHVIIEKLKYFEQGAAVHN